MTNATKICYIPCIVEGALAGPSICKCRSAHTSVAEAVECAARYTRAVAPPGSWVDWGIYASDIDGLMTRADVDDALRYHS